MESSLSENKRIKWFLILTVRNSNCWQHRAAVLWFFIYYHIKHLHFAFLSANLRTFHVTESTGLNLSCFISHMTLSGGNGVPNHQLNDFTVLNIGTIPLIDLKFQRVSALQYHSVSSCFFNLDSAEIDLVWLQHLDTSWTYHSIFSPHIFLAKMMKTRVVHGT